MSRLVFVCVLILTHILATISATLYAGAVVLEVVTGFTIWQSTPLIVLLTALYTITGGLKATTADFLLLHASLSRL